MREGLEHTVRSLHGDKDSPEEGRHVSGQQLCLGLRDYAVKQYGMLAKTVLMNWGVVATSDFGRIVFDMVEASILRKTEEDSIEDFSDVFEFDEAFGDISVNS